jgi:solute carrier family 25 citrate transporter 1
MAPINKGKHKGKALVAGATAGVLEISATYPIEYVKTVLQLSSKKLTTGDVMKMTWKENGFFGFYRGLPSMVYFAAPKAAIRFSSFEVCSNLLTGADGEDKFNLGSLKGFVAGLGAGTAEAIFVTTPQETIKVRLINDAFRTDAPPKYKSFFHGVSSIIKEFGVAGVYKGLVPTIFKVSTVRTSK